MSFRHFARSPSARASSDSTSPKLNLSAPARAMIKRSWAGCSSFLCNLKNSLTRRFTRLRSTALPTLRVTVTPSLQSGWGPGTKITIKCGLLFPRCPRWRRRNSDRLRTLRRLGNFLSRLPSRTLGWCRDRKSLPSLGSATLQNPASPRGRHPRPEAVAPSAPQVARLIRSFHDSLFASE